MPSGFITLRYRFMKRVPVRRLFTFFIWGSGNVIHISSTSPEAKKNGISSILVRRNAAFGMFLSVT
ncbi:hypothetical protein IMSAG192_00057 [Muribaculaceae bacterium]|nr:hypothetical protein IMSAG192_00057 [Muribaculaceae bacterium]